MTNLSPINQFRLFAVTLVALLAYRLASHVPLPGLDLAYISQLGTDDRIRPRVDALMSILALGVLPWFSALTLVELLTVVLPSSWTERFTRSGHAPPFSRVVIGLALTIAALQGLGVAEAMTAQSKMVVAPGSAFLVSTVVTLVGGTAFLIALGLLIERHGLGHGFWIMLAASMLAQLQSHIGVMLLMLREGMASPAATFIAIASTVAISVLIVVILEARRRANETNLSIFIWPLVLASLASGLIVDIAVLVLPIGADDKVEALAKMLTNEPAGFVIGGIIASAFAAIYARREKNWQFFLPAVALIAGVQLQSLIAEAITVQPPLAGASLVIVTAVGYVVLMRVREMMQGT
jgi:preprotein translocase subunit SecY